MSANRFQISGDRVDSQEDFLSRMVDDCFRNVLYYPSKLESKNRKPLIFKNKTFNEVSFKDTDFHNVRFIRCEFRKCLFIGASFTECEFIDCNFFETNMSKLRVSKCLIGPENFKSNFDLVNDTNIAIGLYHALYKNASEEHQPKHAIESLYMMEKATSAHLDSQRNRKKIKNHTYFFRKSVYFFYDIFSGYGLKPWRFGRLLLLFLLLFSFLNYWLSNIIFGCEYKLSFIDSIYFTVVTTTTLGFGDIAPVTSIGRMFVTFQALFGLIVSSLFIAAIINIAVRSR